MRNIMSIRTTVMLCWVAVFWGGVLIGTIHSVSLNGNGYEFTVAISEDALQLDAEQRVPFLDALKKTMTDTSKMLFDATDSKVYFKKVNILLPRAWTLTGAPTSTYNYLNADMRIETTMTANEPETVVQAARSYNSKICGQPGEYIIAPPQFFLNSNGATVKKYGDPAKVMLHEFAHYRYGVHKENGIPGMFIENGDKFPYTFKNPRGEWQLTGSNNSKIEGSYAFPEDHTDYCVYPNTPDMEGDINCRFIPDMLATTGPTTSLMFMPFLPTVTKFSDETNHDRAAPNMQNYWCRNRSTKTIISKHPDFTNLEPSDASTNTVPEFSYLLPAYQTVYIVMDTSSHTLTDDTVFNYVKSEIENKLIPQLAATSPRSFVGIATMGGANFNSTNGRLGGYLTEIQAPIQIKLDNNENILASKVKGLTRSSGQGLLIEKALLDVGDVLTNFTHLSGSIALVFKLNDITNMTEMKVESEAVHLLNSRNARLITFEFNDDSSKNVMERSTLLTGGTHFPAIFNSYQSVISSVLNKTVELVRDPEFLNRRVQLLRDPFTSNSATPFRKFYTVDFVPSSIEMHFFVPVGRPSDYQILVNGTDGKTYSLASAEHVQKYSSWDRKYKIHTFTIPSTSSSTTATFMVNTTGEPLSGFYEAVEILGENVPVYVGGGGQSKNRVIDVEVYTSGKNGVLNMADIYEDPSFLVFASIRKGYSFARALKSAVASVHGPNAIQQSVSLRDDGLYPDLLEKDGIYTGFYKPTVSGIFHVSVLLDGYRRSDPLAQFNNNPSSRSIPIDQNEDSSYLEGGSTTSFQRWIPYAASLDVRSAIFYEERPARIMDFRIDNYDSENQKVTFSWTSPQDSYGKNTSVASYRLVYSLNSDQIINDDGQIPATAVEVDPSTIVEGSLDPLPPFVRHSVIVNLVRDGSAMYFTINSKSTLGVESYAAPMVYLTESEPPVTTVSTTTVTTPTTAAVTTPTTSTTTSKPTTASTAARTSTVTTKPTSTTTAQPSGAQITRVSSALFYSLFSVALILISAL